MIHVRLAVVEVFSLLLLSLIVLGQVNQDCYYTNGLPGRCVRLKQCPPVAKLVNRVFSYPGEERKIKALFNACGSSEDASVPIVCCESPQPERRTVGTSATTPGLLHPITKPTTVQPRTTTVGPQRLFSEILPQHCGIKNKLGFNINTDVEDTDNHHPWVVYLEIPTSNSTGAFPRCVGTLIHESFVLTAAHCLHNLAAQDIELYFGNVYIPTLEQCVSSDECYKRRAKQLIVHKDYNKHNRLNDIALIWLNEAITPSEDVVPACLPLSSNIADSLQHVVSLGWGQTAQGDMSDSKRMVMLNVIPPNECSRQMKNYNSYRLDDTMLLKFICTVGHTSGQDVCNGDSGAPLLSTYDKKYYVAGIVSFGPKCGTEIAPGASVRVSEYKDWILLQLKRTSFD